MEVPNRTWGPKPDLNQRNQEMHILVGLQDQGRRIFARSCEEKLRQNRELIPSLQKALQEDSTFLNFVLKYNKLPIKDAFGELVSGTESLEVTAGLEAGAGALGTLRTVHGRGTRCQQQDNPTGLLWRHGQAPRAKPSQTPSCQTSDNILEQNLSVPSSTLGGVFWAASSLENGLMPIQVAVKKMEAKLHDQVKTCDMLAHQLKLWSQARDERQRRLQDLQDAEADPKWRELQTIRQLGNDIEKMLMKINSGEIVTNLYLRLQEVLRRELVYQPRYLDLLSGMTVMYHQELTSKTTVLPNRVIKKLMAEAGPRVRVEKHLRDQSLAEQKKHLESLRRQEESERQQRQQAVSMLSAEQDQSSSETLLGADVEAAMARMQREAFLTDKMEKAKTALQCSCLWDIPSSIEAQRKSLENLQQHIDECNEKKNVLKKTLQNLESKQAKLKFNQPVSTARCCWPRAFVPARPCCQQHGAGLQLGWGSLNSFWSRFGVSLHPCAPVDVSVAGSSMQEEELREKLRQEEARLEQMRAHMLNNQKRLIEFENIIDNMFLRLQGISIPGKEDSGEVHGMEEKLQHCEQKLQFLKEQAAARPEDSPDEQSETFAKVRNLLEERTAGEKQNLRITFEDEGATEHDSLDFEEEEEDYVPSREDIKKQGQQLIRMNTRRRKKK
ncbi:coiled-coil domain-containing protein 183 [Zonotrichia albicollis]|uniref:coiled-coil domain-containing protein 183 n=1 Tax=Zonotrichia albicollis TaxID=44394 RepID=UPI003D80F5F2